MSASLQSFPALLFDGERPVPQPVRLDLLGTELLIWDAEQHLVRRAALKQVRLSEPFRRAPRMIGLADGTTLQVDDSAGLTAALGSAGLPPPLVVRLQQRWPAAVLALALLVALLVFGYLRGLPAAAQWAAFALPPTLERQLGDHVLEYLDDRHLGPSQLDPERRERLAQRFTTMAAQAAPNLPYRLEFRASQARAKERARREGRDPRKERETDPPPEGLNAFALPGGTIVLLDGLVLTAPSDEAVLAVLGHELGHVKYKHVMTHLIEAAGVGGVAGLLWGDFAGIAANVPVLLGALKYSRDAERKADAFAVDFLRINGLGVEPLLGFFEFVDTLQKQHGGSPPDFISTHPSTPERIERLRQAKQMQHSATPAESAPTAAPR